VSSSASHLSSLALGSASRRASLGTGGF
jgi:hypothetical protein